MVRTICFPDVYMVASFSFETAAECGANDRVVGYALPINACYYDDDTLLEPV